jgi:hypothetical protein
VENGGNVPSFETPEVAAAIEVQRFRKFWDETDTASVVSADGHANKHNVDDDETWADKRFFREIKRLQSRAGQQNGRLGLSMARRTTHG